ncbi:tetratricopeptide repeat protein [Tamlana sp. 2_MG-2023]|uniref:tetratricopeptide repeat protein n=1 Tax=unclassified Tamlana TaxID=2614803 RepID=UPI0026E2AE3F|nr:MULTISPECIES: tetratricopeptide repeat protein [unclassified Tamlana]MDO6760873.1 tetratricopeptide repeat protein [Tamlana sp. 2_MG-2023]MDO6791129.1 tetratricopeptide repeat protein [Tamlana sp. 1_MG-2023]
MIRIWLFILLPLLGFSQGNFAEVDTLFEKKQYQKAEVFLTNYLQKHPNNLEARALLGDTYGYQKEWDKAISTYKMVVEKDKTNASYFYNYGTVLGMKALENRLKAMAFVGDIREAFLKAAELDKNHIDTRWALVHLYMNMPGIIGGSKKEALRYAQELEALSKVDGYLAKGFIYEYDDDFEEAETYYKKAVKVGGSLTCYMKLMTLYEHEDLPQKAIETLETAQQNLQDNTLRYQIGRLSAMNQVQLEKGLTNLNQYLKYFTQKDQVPKAWAHYRLSQIYRYQSDKNQALKHINLALKELPKEEKFQDEKAEILDL